LALSSDEDTLAEDTGILKGSIVILSTTGIRIRRPGTPISTRLVVALPFQSSGTN
jgi:hypothetical protein